MNWCWLTGHNFVLIKETYFEFGSPLSMQLHNPFLLTECKNLQECHVIQERKQCTKCKLVINDEIYL